MDRRLDRLYELRTIPAETLQLLLAGGKLRAASEIEKALEHVDWVIASMR
jgi:hypothetical protein